ncbi:hypothetical protein [Halohasta salina]|uniref:hypothetical protein n=1 Tax=Halohasta salina TaxID=2961621 RepID=UPI0020A36A00|nr:hypothetical protein [Halohasta salina]
MHRRRICRTAAAVALTGVAGCLDVDGPVEESSTGEPDDPADGTDQPTNETMTEDVPTDVIDSDRITAARLMTTGECEASGTAAVDFGTRVIVTGCLTGHNGCAEPVVEAVSDIEGGLRVVVGEEDRSDPGTACTQALVQRGYELALEFEGDLPAAVEVVHDDAMGRETVVTDSGS